MIENNKFLIKKMKTKIKMEISDILECMEGNGEVDETEGKKKKTERKKGDSENQEEIETLKKGKIKGRQKAREQKGEGREELGTGLAMFTGEKSHTKPRGGRSGCQSLIHQMLGRHLHKDNSS